MLVFLPAQKGSRSDSLSPSLLPLPPSLPVTSQRFTVECQGDGDVTLPTGWRPLRPTRVPRQRKALSDCAPPGLARRGFCAPALSAAEGTPYRNSGCPPLAGVRVRAPLSANELQDLRAEPSRVLPSGFEDPLGCFPSERPRKMDHQPRA